MIRQAHVAQWKREVVNDLTRILKNNKVVAVVNVGNIPAPQLQQIKKRLRGKAEMIMSRNTLINIAIEEVSKERQGLKSLKDLVGGQCALLGTNMNAFKLYRELEATRTRSAAKPGDISPEDIVIKEGETPFKPGPIVGELQKVGIPAGIEGGKVVFKKDKVLVKKGEKIPAEIAKILPKLDIYPMMIGLELLGAFEDGIIFKKDDLAITPDHYQSMIATAARNAFSLSIHIAYVTPQTIRPLLARAYREGVALAVAAAFPTKDNIKILLAKAEANMLALASRISGFEDERLRQRLTTVPAQVKPEQPKAEEHKEEKKEEKVSEEEAAAGLSALFG
ncbi:MAG: 50S ribosomal protein L10 [Methanomassiliicoccales archaeon]|jgi:large subunit ribosomal protein L10|nr:50S ribosomal protein L10 [Methanomassiliicoccales archaeon]